jgi:hypothetical protein
LALGLRPGRLRADISTAISDFAFVVVNDLHFREEACAAWFEQAVAAMKTSAPAAELCFDRRCGEQRNMKEVYENLDIVVSCSTEPEPFGIGIVEAIWNGLPLFQMRVVQQISSATNEIGQGNTRDSQFIVFV